jgi:hypothetical protein
MKMAKQRVSLLLSTFNPLSIMIFGRDLTSSQCPSEINANAMKKYFKQEKKHFLWFKKLN